MGKIFIVLFLALAVGLAEAQTVIKELKRFKFGQNISKWGPQEHLKKQGTPTMGGFIFLIPIVLIGLIFLWSYPVIRLILIGMLLFGLIGFTDDYLMIKKKSAVGLTPLMKILMNIVFGILMAYLLFNQGFNAIHIPFTGKVIELSLPLYSLFVVIFYTSVTNSVNLSDGVDGLCASITIVVLLFYMVLTLTKDGKLPYGNEYEIAQISSIAIGSLLAYLFFNWHPSRVMMGDTGSFSLGGLLATIAIATGTEIMFILIGLVYVVEALSDIIQISSKKLRAGKRVFLMAPIHHHFEKKGWSENKIVGIFSLFTLISCILAYVLFFMK